MPSTRDIRRRIKSVKNTAQITKAMQLVAASKMKKAQDQAIAGRHYSNLINKVLVSLKEKVVDESHELLEEREGDKELVILVTTDKGLCGGLNTNLIRKTLDEAGDSEFPQCQPHPVGGGVLARPGRRCGYPDSPDGGDGRIDAS